MSSYISLTAPRRKKAPREKSGRMYSTLSKKPAGLDTTDVDLSAVRVFLSDGSHTTVSSTPNTTCGEILTNLLGKLGLSQQRDKYGLQVKYKYSESRIAGELEKVSDLNQDSVDRIFLCKKDILSPHHLQGRKKCESMEPVLLNEKVASGFARAWSVGLERHKAGEHGGQKPLEVNPTFEPVCQNSEADGRRATYSSYTLDRKPKSTARRRTTVSSPRATPCSTPKHFSVQTSPTSPMTGTSTSPAQTTSPHLSRHEDSRKLVRRQRLNPFASRERPSSKEDEDQLPNTFEREKSQSVGCLLSLMDFLECEQSTDISRTSSQLTLRDSGFDDSNDSMIESKHSSSIRDSREKSGSLDNLTSSCFFDDPWQAHTSPAMSVPSFAEDAETHESPTTSQGDTPQHATNFNAATLKSAQSIELLTEEDFDTITNATLVPSHDKANQGEMNTTPPPIPKRSSAYLENCTIPDDYLLSQGRRINQLIQITPKKEEKKHFKSLQAAFTRVGTLLKKGKSSPTAYAPHTPTLTRIRGKPGLGFPSGSLKGISPDKMTSRTSQVEPVEEIQENDTPQIVIEDTLSPSRQKDTDKKLLVRGLSTCNLLTEPQCTLPVQSSTIKPCSSLVDLRNTGKNQDSLPVDTTKTPPKRLRHLTIISSACSDPNLARSNYGSRNIESDQTPSTSGSQHLASQPSPQTKEVTPPQTCPLAAVQLPSNQPPTSPCLTTAEPPIAD